jgi:UDP-2,4-diacetamido-2,4,6-trideoxy-beta-L-altropyranose hydrolase
LYKDNQNNSNTPANGALLIIRTDAGDRIGIGHLMRCLTIARVWKQTGGKVIFVMTSLSENLGKFLKSFEIDFIFLDVGPGSTIDAEQTSSLAAKLNASWIIADGYWFGPGFQKVVQAGSSKLMLIDPLGVSQYNYANIILNANIYANEDYYQNREPHTQLLLGPRFLPLRSDFTGVAPITREKFFTLSNVLVSLGGGDPDNVTGHVLRFLIDFPIDCHCNVIIGPANQNLSRLKQLSLNHGHRITLLQSPKNMHELMAWADVTILAGGSTVWEAMYMGVPTLLLSYADNQLRVAPKLGEMGYAIYSGHFNGAIPAKFGHDLKNILTDSSLRSILSKRGRQLIDGRGNERIIQAMLT